jgi:hypothetical protein
MKLAVYTFTYSKEDALILPLVERINAARGDIPLEDIVIVVLNDPRSPLSGKTVDALGLVGNVILRDTATDRRGNLRGCDFVAEASELMSTLVPDADFIIKLDPDTVPISLEGIIQPLIDDPDLTANLIPANRNKTFAMGYCYAYSMAAMQKLAEACKAIDAPTFNMAVEYLAAALPASAKISYNFPAREDMFLSVLAARIGKVSYGMRATVVSEGDKRDLSVVRARHDVVLLYGSERWGRQRMVALGDVFLNSVARPRRKNGEEPIYVLGTGTCFSGTVYISKLLGHQPGVHATHEFYGGVSREPMLDYSSFLPRLAHGNDAQICADISAAHVEHLRALLSCARENGNDLRVFGIIRDPALLLASFRLAMEESNTDYFISDGGEQTQWSRVYPCYDDEPDSDARIMRYIRFVHEELAGLASEFPDNVFLVQLEDLNTEVGVNLLFDKLGVPVAGRRLEAIGMRVNAKVQQASDKEDVPLLPFVPQVLPAWRVKAIVEIEGLTQMVSDALASISNPVIRVKAALAWSDGNEIRRDDPILNAMLEPLGLLPSVVDEMFIKAQKL